MFLLDTDVLSEMRKSKPHGAVVSWLNETDDSDLHVSAMTVGEIQKGIESTRRTDVAKAASMQEWLDDVCRTRKILVANDAIFRIWARLMHAQQSHLFANALIAATAIHHGLTVATRNTKDFEPFGVLLTNPFSARR
jgi:toxin FitB